MEKNKEMLITTNKYITVTDCKYDASIHGEFEGEFEREHFTTKFKWDDFQLHSYQAIKRDENLLVIAPTSSGKTSVAKYAALYNCIHKGGRVIYTTPIKSLSNEKYGEMKELLIPYNIQPGLLTGDQKINTDSKFIIMTAEILSNALFMIKNDADCKNEDIKNKFQLDKEFITSVDCVIIDEIHFISDETRGHIWENILILLDSKVQIVGLSATIDNPEKFASWIGEIKQKKITLVKKYDRPVPLEYAIFDGDDLNTIMNINGEYNYNVFTTSIEKLKNLDTKHKKNKTNKVNYLLNNFIKYSQDKDLLQLCFIIFSKKNCEKFAETVNIGLITSKESAIAIKELEYKMAFHLKSYENMPRFKQIKSLIQKGICFHHAGLPVILKEVIEHMFKTGHIKLLFATETIAVGVNMPIRTLVLCSIEKGTNNQNIRSLTAAEFKQISGRAGRRGLDTKGLIVFLPLYNLPSEIHIRTELLFGPMPKIVSKMELTYHSFLKLIDSNTTNMDSFYDNSLLYVQNKNIINNMQSILINLIDNHEKAKNDIDIFIKTNNIEENISLNIEKYINMSKHIGSDNPNIMIKLNKQQEKDQKKIKMLIKKNTELYKLYVNAFEKQTELNKTNLELEFYKTYKNDKYQQLSAYLRIMGYLTENNEITQYGIMASYINECNPFILTEIFTNNILQTLTAKQIICFLSILTEKINNNNKIEITLKSITIDPIIIKMIEYTENRINNYIDTETNMNLYSENEYWSLSYDYLEISNLWTNIDFSKEDHSKILSKLYMMEEYEGSFIKNMLKINNIVGNLMTLCNLTRNLDLLPVLQEIEPLIIKGMVNVDSIHVM